MIIDTPPPSHADLPLCCLHLHGNDSFVFLQGQLTNDLSLLSQEDESWQWSALCNPKGRAIATFIIWKKNDDYWLLCLANIAEKIKKHLTKYILRSKVTIELKPCDIQIKTNASPSHSTAFKSISISSTHTLLINETSNNGLNNEKPINEFKNLWVSAQLPFIGQELTETLIPNHFDFEKHNGISYKKGCFTGQEVIARLHYLSKPQYALYAVQSDHFLSTGAELFEPTSFRDQAIGHIMASCHDTNNRCYNGFACIKIKAADHSTAMTLSNDNDDQMVTLANK